MVTAYQTLHVHTDPTESVTVLTLARAQAANALNTHMAMEIKDFFDNIARIAPVTRVILLTGEAPYFCAGADLKERKGMNEAQWHAQHAAFEAALQALTQCRLPVLAAVNGAAYAGGLELALACDFIYAADSARFAFSETTLGIIPGLGGTQRLPRAVGMARAKEIIMTGKPFSAQEALEWGMVNRLCPQATLLEEAHGCARTIAKNAPLALRATKSAVDEGTSLPIGEALACELRHYHTLLNTADRHEGVNAFNEKRKPVFTGA